MNGGSFEQPGQIRPIKVKLQVMVLLKKLLIAFLLLMTIETTAGAQTALNVMTFNIRLNVASDGLNAWPLRKDHAASQVLFHHTSILGVQEALHGQMLDLQERLPGYRFIGVGRDDGQTAGEYSAIFYDTARLAVLDGSTFWLSRTPGVPGSKDWDAAITRIVTWGKFRDKNSGTIFFAFNTHFDHIGKVARAESAQIILKAVDSLAGHMPVVVTGDFNAQPSDEPIRILTNKTDPLHLVDSKSASETPHYGPNGTFTGFQAHETSDQPIDHIFIKNGIKVLQHATLSETWEGRFSSDHFPVFARIQLQ